MFISNLNSFLNQFEVIIIMKWRFIESGTFDAATNMAIDHAIYENVALGREKPTIRFYKWKRNSVSIGAFQNPDNIDLELCRKNGIDVVRRMTGGRAVFHDKEDFTYSVISHIRNYKYRIDLAYKEICDSLINTLKDLGIKAKLENKNDLIVNGKKISGNAAKAMHDGVYLQHGTLIFKLDFEIMPQAMKIDPELAKMKATSISTLKKTTQEKVHDAMKSNFLFGKHFEKKKISHAELDRAEELVKNVYSKLDLPFGSISRDKGVCYTERGG